MKIIYKITIWISLPLVMISCEDFVKIDMPRTQIPSEMVFSDKATAEAAILGIYARMFNTAGLTSALTRSNGLAADELIAFSVASNIQFYTNELTPLNASVSSYWNELYQYIYTANVILEVVPSATLLDETTRTILQGEARFIRAFCYYYLVNLWGDVPLITSSDYNISSRTPRQTKEDTYIFLIKELRTAVDLLPEDYSFSNGEKLRPNKYAAMAVLARLYLLTEDWANAELYASQIIDNTNLYGLEQNMDKVFLRGSTEAIWQLRSGLSSGRNTSDAEIFILTTQPTIALREDFINTFESDDLRKTNWIKQHNFGGNTYHHPFKYKIRAGSTTPPITEYLMVIRLAEIYLIRAEARAQQDNLIGAIADVDMIRQRAGLARIADTNTEISQEDLLSSIVHERKCELFTEWGHRWLDLKRLGLADLTLSILKDNWQSTDVLYPIPQSEMERAPSLKPQNPGY